MCVSYRERLVVPTVLRKAERVVSQQDLESLVFESNGRIAFYSDASLSKYVDGNDDDDHDDDVTDPVPSKIASEANLSRARGDTSLRGKKKLLRKKLN